MILGRLALVAVVAVVGAGCESGGDDATVVGAPPPPESSLYVLPVPALEADPVDTEPPTLATYRENDEGVVLPDPDITTGTSFPDVTSADICELHYTQGVRQPRFNDKVESFANYGISIRERDVYAVDHLVPVALGGSNTIANLWPQPYDDVAGAAQKNELERQLRGLVCAHELTLTQAQHLIADDWWSAYETYMDVPVDPALLGPEVWEPPTVEEGEVVNGGPCEVEGEVGYTEPKRVPLTCTLTSFGELRWQKRY